MTKTAQPIMLCASLCLILAACGLPDGNLPYNNDTPDPVETDPEPTELLKPMLMPISSSTCSNTIPVYGSVQGGGMIIIQGGLSSTTQEANPTTGKFCMDVPLRPGTVNLLEVQVSDPKLGLSEPSLVTVEQVECDEEDTPQPQDKAQATNVILGAHPFSNKMPSSGDASSLTDGDPETTATYKGAGTWIIFKLEELTTLEKMVIHWREWLDEGDEQFGSFYAVIGSNEEDPGDPKFYNDGVAWQVMNSDWFIIHETKNGTGCLSKTCGMDIVNFDDQPEVQYIGVLMQVSGSAFWSQKFAINELEIWDKPKKTGPTLPTDMVPTCANLDDLY